MRSSYVNDLHGRVSMLSVGATDFVVEYGTSRDALRARAVMYRQVKKLCALRSASELFRPVMRLALLENDDEDDDNIPSEWFEVPFWESFWEPSFADFASIVPPPAPNPNPLQCIANCQVQCDVLNDLNQIGCAALGGLVATGNAGAGVVVGAVCALGSLGGKYVCRNTDCPRTC
jgi:hypothetical protein